MAKRKRRAAKRAAVATSAPPPRVSPGETLPPASEDDRIEYSNLSLHELFQQQAMRMIERTDLDDEQKQSILIAMSCPCCGAGGLSFVAKIRRRATEDRGRKS